MKKIFPVLFLCIALAYACRQSSDAKHVQPSVPGHPVPQSESHITQEYIDSLTQNRQQRIIDLRREVGFHCVNLLDNDYVHMKIKVMPDGSYKDIEVIEKEGIDMETIRDCITNYFKENKWELGELKDLPSSGKTTNQHPHVYTLLIY